MAVLLLLTEGCSAGAPAPPPMMADCVTGQCVTTIPAQTAGSAMPPSIGTPSPASSPVTTALSSTPVAFRSDAAALGPVVWARAVDDETRAPRDQETLFATDTPTIYATVAVERIAAGTTVEAEWSYNRTRLESLDQAIVVERADTGVWLEFHLALTQGGTWPTGTYDVSVAVNGTPAVAGSVEVGQAPP